MNLTKEQQKILDECHKNMYISAAPGSGKSTMLSQIGARLLDDKKNYLGLVTFTNKAAKSIIAKCEGVDTTRILGGTFHSIAYHTAKQRGLGWNICDEGKKRLLIKKLFNCKKDKQLFEEIYQEISLAKSEYPLVCADRVLRYQNELYKYNLIDFDDMIYEFIAGLKDKTIGLPKITHLLVDELQDTSGPQLEMLKAMQEVTGCNMIGVADDDQCQPGPTTVLTTKGYKRMDALDPKTDRLVSYIRKGSYVGGLKDGYEFDISSRKYTGNLYEVICDNKNPFATTNHKWLVKWSKEAKSKDINVVYLMRKDNKYRMGWCQLFNSEGSFHLGTRSRLEKADAAWIIEVCHSKREASISESALAFSYGIPTITFEQSTGGYHDKDAIEIIYKSIGHKKIQDRAEQLLKDAKLSKDYPIWSKELAYQKQGGSQIFITQSCNLIPKLMELPIHVKGKAAQWKTIDMVVSHGCSHIDVYSLNVKPHETYICKGVITHNSIYVWRGARPENVTDFIKTFNTAVLCMGTNFRSTKQIVKSSATLIKNNKSRLEKTIRAKPDAENGVVLDRRCQNEFDEIDYVVRKCKIEWGRKLAILYRNRTHKNYLEFELRKANLKYTVNDALEITDRSAVRVMLACLRIGAMSFDEFDLETATKGIKGFGLTTAKSLIKRVTDDKTLPQVLREAFYDTKGLKRIQGLLNLRTYYNAHDNEPLDLLVRYAETQFKDSFDYQDDMRSFLVDIAGDFKINSSDIKCLCNELGLDGKEEHNDEDADIELSTIHGYKGLERDIVIMPWCQNFLTPKSDKKIDVEDERRLFYVGATRAKNKLIMTYSGPKPKFIKEMKL